MKILGRVSGIVKKGRGEGEHLGFKTANLEVPYNEIPVCEGVYLAYANVERKVYKSAVSVGVSPVFASDTTSNIEVHIIDLDMNLYGKVIEIYFVKFLRPMINFSSKEELIKTVKKNIEQANNLPYVCGTESFE